VKLAPLAILLVAATSCVPAGCGGSSPHDGAGEQAIEIFGPYRGTEADRFVETLQPFVEASGVDVRYIGSVDFVADLRQRVGEDNDPPDLAVVPQPGLIRQLAADGSIVELGPEVEAAVAANYPRSTAAFGRIDGDLRAVPFRLNLKSLVWFRPEVFAEHGWRPPQTLDELDTLAARIESESELAPWCFSMSAGSATGWAATDWVEDIVVRTAGPETYRRWAHGGVAFADPEIESAFARFQALVLAPGRVAGGLTAVVDTPVDEALRPLFADPPGCALYKQADFAASWMPAGTSIGVDGDVTWFLLPGTTAGRTAPLLVGGDQIVQFRHDPDVDALMAYLAGPDAGASWARRGGFLSPKSSLGRDVYPPGFNAQLAAALGDVPAVVFDASDQMPPDIGSGLLWSGITRWVSGVDDYARFARRLDRARDAATRDARPEP
jgi:alpha-glucoside transport system substrate-binding protein